METITTPPPVYNYGQFVYIINQDDENGNFGKGFKIQGLINRSQYGKGMTGFFYVIHDEQNNEVTYLASELSEYIPKQCDQCTVLTINRVFTHETGCPNSRKTWFNGEWVQFYKCSECGDDVPEGEQCQCQEIEENN